MGKKILDCFKPIFNGLFPSALAYVNFWALWGFFLAMVTGKEPIAIGIGALGSIYCLNEWTKAVLKK